MHISIGLSYCVGAPWLLKSIFSPDERELPVSAAQSAPHVKPTSLTFQDLLFRLQGFWAERGCVLQQPYDVEVGAGTMAPETFLRVLGPKPYKVGYAQPSRRPADGRYGENPNRLFKHTQFQLILKPPPVNVQELYLESLEAIGIDLKQHDLKFEEDNWEWPAGGAWGVGWQVMLDGLEITQFTYFQQCGGLDLDPICAELTYGLERIAQFLQDVDSIYDIVWARDPETGAAVTYGDVRLAEELQFSVYNFEYADVPRLWEHFNSYEAEAQALLDQANTLLADETAQPRGEAPLPAAGHLRTGAQVLEPLQSSRRARRHQRYRARRRDRPHSQPGRRRRQGVCIAASCQPLAPSCQLSAFRRSAGFSCNALLSYSMRNDIRFEPHERAGELEASS